jgi:hypothetical protein
VLAYADKIVRIGAMAWPTVITTLKRYEIIELRVQPELYVELVDGPPGYPIAVGVEESKEATEFFARSSPTRSSPTRSSPTRTSGAKPTSNKHPAGKGGSKPTLRLK